MSSFIHSASERAEGLPGAGGATDVAEALLVEARRCEFRGYDPFDGLNSRIFARSGLNRSALARIGWIQLHKRSLLNLRPLVGVEKTRNPKGIALFILGLLAHDDAGEREQALIEAAQLGDWLIANRVDRAAWKHSAWGYPFDWAARAFFVPQGKPNAITTCYVARALLALGEATGMARFTEAAVDAGRFLDSLYRESGEHCYYTYIPGETAFVHNASLWSAAVAASTAARGGGERGATIQARALDAARQSAAMQRPDGAWTYGTRAHHQFIDGFHTGYNLEALHSLQRTLAIHEFDSVIEQGLDYYRTHFFSSTGDVKYYHDDAWPLDTHSMAQAVVTLLEVGGENVHRALAGKVVSRALKTLYMPERGRFVYQKKRLFTNRINYLRWTQAWAFYALRLYVAHARSG